MYIFQPKSNIQFKLRESERSRMIQTFLGLDNQKDQLRWQRPGRASWRRGRLSSDKWNVERSVRYASVVIE